MRQILINGLNGVKTELKWIEWVWWKFNRLRDEMLMFLSREYIPAVFTPNRLSFFRVGLAGIIFLMLFHYNQCRRWIIGLFICSVITDIFDGPLARVRGLETREGAFLDRISDKLLICPLVFRLLWESDKLLVGILVGSEFFSAALAIVAMKRNLPVKSNWYGKWKMAFQSIGVIVLLIFPFKMDFAIKILWFALGLGLASLLNHFQPYLTFRSNTA